jgi:hypothetical protein
MQKDRLTEQPIIDPERLRRNKPKEEVVKKPKEQEDVSAGPVKAVVEYLFNPTDDKIREVTDVDRMQGRLLPQLDVINAAWEYIIEISTYRQDADVYKLLYNKEKPEPPDLHKVFIHRTAQWQKSIGGKNMQSAVDITLAETEARAGDVEEATIGRGFEDDK